MKKIVSIFLLLLVLFFSNLAAQTDTTLVVGSGTEAYSAHPYSSSYMDERTQYIITKSELISAGWSAAISNISAIAFQISTASTQSINGFTITIAHTSSSTFGSTTFLLGTNSTIVYSGSITTNSGWNNYIFSSPFEYNGTSNLLINICWNNSTSSSNSVIVSTSYVNYVALYYRANLSGADVCSQATGTQSYYRPNTKITFFSQSCGIPTGLVANAITTSDAMLNWNTVSVASSYNIRYKATSVSNWITTSSSTTSSLISGLNESTNYEFQVQAVCADIGIFSSSTIFTTLPLSTVNCDMTLKTTIEGFKVYQHNPTGTIMYKAKMYIDADGSPRAYGPNNSGLDYTANAGSTGNWWGVVADINGNPVLQGSGDPYPGMYVSTTSLVNSSYSSTNPLRYTNSETVPFFVLPSAVTSLGGIHIGDIGYVFNTITGLGCYAIYADAGPAGKLGEGSIYLAGQIGVNPNPRTGGTSLGIIDYIVFPQSGFGQGTIPTLTQINDIGAIKINTVGGINITDCLDPNLDIEEKMTQNQLNIYPNPNNGFFTATIANSNKPTSLEVFNILGKNILTKHNPLFSEQIDLTCFVKGIYFVKFVYEKGQNIEKIIVK